MSQQTDRYISTGILNRQDPALGRDLVYFSEAIKGLDNDIIGLQRQITALPVTPTGTFLVAGNNLSDVASANTSLNNLLPSQATHAGKFLTTNGANTSWAVVPAGTVTSVSGTLNRITSTGGVTPVIDISASYLGQTSLTTLGTVVTGTWNATRIAEIYGGTNQNTYATGDLLYASGVNTLSKLTATTNGFVLTLAAGVPVWAAAGAGTPSLTSTQIAYGDGANLMTSSANFTRTTAKITITPDGTGALGGLYITRGDAVNQYIVLHENVTSPNSAYLTFKSSGGNAIAMGAIFAAGAPVSYVFTDPSGVPLNTIDVTTGANTLLNLAGVGTRMVTVTAAGVLSTAAIVTNTTIANDPIWAALGDIVYGTGAATGAILAGHTNADNRYLKQTGTGAVSAAPQWVRFDAGDIATGTLATGILAVTQAAGINNTTIATTAYADALTRSYCISGGTIFHAAAAAYNPADATTYFYGARSSTITSATVTGVSKIYFPQAGTIIAVRITFTQTPGTSETSTCSLRVNNTSDITISSAVINDATNNTFIITGLTQAVNATSDYVEIKWVTPTWATNPTACCIFWEILVKPT